MIPHRTPLHRAADTAVFWLCVALLPFVLLYPYFVAIKVTQ